MPLVRRKKPPNPDAASSRTDNDDDDDDSKKPSNTTTKSEPNPNPTKRRWSCVDSCCWLIGCICTTWWLLLFLLNTMPSSFPEYVTQAITGPLPDPPGVKLRKEGLVASHPVVFVPGIVTGGLELWEGRQCAEGLFRKRLWGGTFGDIYKR